MVTKTRYKRIYLTVFVKLSLQMNRTHTFNFGEMGLKSPNEFFLLRPMLAVILGIKFSNKQKIFTFYIAISWMNNKINLFLLIS